MRHNKKNPNDLPRPSSTKASKRTAAKPADQKKPTQRSSRKDSARPFDLSSLSLTSYAKQAEYIRLSLSPEKRSVLQSRFEVTDETLQRLRAGWNGSKWTLPMLDETGRITGIELRDDRDKVSWVGPSRPGLFIPKDFGFPEQLWIFDDVGDAAAALNLGLDCVAWSSLRRSDSLIRRFVVDRRPKEVIVACHLHDSALDDAFEVGDALLPHAFVRVVQSSHMLGETFRDQIASGQDADDLRAWAEYFRPLHLLGIGPDNKRVIAFSDENVYGSATTAPKGSGN